MLDLLRLIYVRHHWRSEGPRRTCTVCGRIEAQEEHDDPHGPSLLWMVVYGGERRRHLAAPTRRGGR